MHLGTKKHLIGELLSKGTTPHLTCPRVQYTDRGKSAIVVDGDDR